MPISCLSHATIIRCAANGTFKLNLSLATPAISAVPTSSRPCWPPPTSCETTLEMVFHFIGGGHQIGELERQAKERGLTNFRFTGYQDRSALKYSLCVPDVHWISLRPEVEGLIVPSKFYGIAAAGRPIVAICAKDGEIARLVNEHRCGYVIPPGDSVALADTLRKLSSNISMREELGRRARTMIDSHFTRNLALKRWRDVLRQIA